MSDLSIATKLLPYKPKHKVRFVTAASLFDGHDASINIMRRILQSTGVEVIHLGHNRSVDEIVNAETGICFGPDTLAEARNRGYKLATPGLRRRHRKPRA